MPRQRMFFCCLLLACLCHLSQQATTISCFIPKDKEGGEINLKPLGLLGDVTLESKEFPGYEYLINICGELSWYQEPECPEGTMVCERFNRGTISASTAFGFISTAQISRAIVDKKTAGATLVTKGQACSKGEFAATVYLLCDPDDNTNSLSLKYEDYAQCVVEFEMRTAHACEVEASGGGGTDVGMILTITFFVTLSVYFAGGMAYNYHQKKEGGEIVPNVGFWKELPGLVKDGAVYSMESIGKCFGKLRGDAEYQPLE